MSEKVNKPNLNRGSIRSRPGRLAYHAGCGGLIGGQPNLDIPKLARTGRLPRRSPKMVLHCTECGHKVGRQATKYLEEFMEPKLQRVTFGNFCRVYEHPKKKGEVAAEPPEVPTRPGSETTPFERACSKTEAEWYADGVASVPPRTPGDWIHEIVRHGIATNVVEPAPMRPAWRAKARRESTLEKSPLKIGRRIDRPKHYEEN